MRGSDSELGDLHLIPSGGTYAEAGWLWRKDKCVPDANLFRTGKEAHDASTRSEPVTAVTQRLLQLLAQQPACAYGNAIYVQGRTAE
jgi:hypothetical protein